jgi:hypothetical protein
LAILWKKFLAYVGVKSFGELAMRFGALLGLSVVADKTGDVVFGSSEQKTQEQVNAYLRNLANQLDSRGIRVKRCTNAPCSDYWPTSAGYLHKIAGHITHALGILPTHPPPGLAFSPLSQEQLVAARRRSAEIMKKVEQILAENKHRKSQFPWILMGMGIASLLLVSLMANSFYRHSRHLKRAVADGGQVEMQGQLRWA